MLSLKLKKSEKPNLLLDCFLLFSIKKKKKKRLLQFNLAFTKVEYNK